MQSRSTIAIARQLFCAGRWTEAARVARRAAAQDPRMAGESATIVGMSMLRAGRAAEARPALEYALSQNPTSTTLQLACTQVALATGDESALERAIDTATVGVEKQRAALRRARRELPANNAFASLEREGDWLTPDQWEAAISQLLSLGRLDDAERLLTHPPPKTQPSVARVLAARAASAREDSEAAVAAWRETLALAPTRAGEAFEALLHVDACQEAAEVAQRALESTGDTLLVGRLALYQGRPDDAEALLLKALPSTERRTSLAALALLRGDLERVEALLANVAREPSEALLYIEARRRAGHAEEAKQAYYALPAATLAEVAAAPLCQITCLGTTGPYNVEERELLGQLRLDFPELASVEDSTAFAEAAIDALSGNWTRSATRPHHGATRKQPIARPMREQVAALRQALWVLPLPVALSQCEALEAQHGAHPLIATYGAELLLWWGDYDQASAWLARALELEPRSRWGHIGTAIWQNVTGEPEAALETMARQSAQLAPLPNSSACTAESHLLLGDFERAEADYRVALEGHPTRVSAWLGLALARHQQGADHRHALAQVRRVTPVFYRQWQREAGSLHGNSSATPDQLQHAFTMLRGNRGSGLITWWTADGAFHGEHVARATQG